MPARLLGVVGPGVLGIAVATLIACREVEAAFRPVAALGIVEQRSVLPLRGSDPFGAGPAAIQTVQSGTHVWSVAVGAVLVVACCWTVAVAVAHAVARIGART
ncbi:MAG: hypothetical protein ACOCRD_02525 [Halorubrum sp.]